MSFTTLEASTNLFKGHVPYFELLQCSKTLQVIPGIDAVQRAFHW
jgi:hypothetical protein